ncbi:hypothetical protein OQA88_13578 [Cercophora sp. LCS_1]
MSDDQGDEPTARGGKQKHRLAKIPDIPPRSSSRKVLTTSAPKHETFGPTMSPRFNPADQFASLYQELRRPPSRVLTSTPPPVKQRQDQSQKQHDKKVQVEDASFNDRDKKRQYENKAREGNSEGLEPLNEENVEPGSFDLLAPSTSHGGLYPLERLAEQLLSKQHLEGIFSDPLLLKEFSAFIRTFRPDSAPLLGYYFDSIKALKAIAYANSVIGTLKPLDGMEFSRRPGVLTRNKALKEKADLAFQALVDEELPAFITQTWIRMASRSIEKRITGTLSPHLRQMSEGLAEVFCLTDPKREDNPVIFASEEFYRMTQYGRTHVIGRNCRFLQGPKTDPNTVNRMRRNLASGKDSCEVVLNYRRDGSPFMNLVMCSPLLDSFGTLRYMIGAQVDVTGLVRDSVGLEAFQKLVEEERRAEMYNVSPSMASDDSSVGKDALKELSEMFNAEEMETVRNHGGAMRRLQHEGIEHEAAVSNWQKPRVVIRGGGRDSDTDMIPELSGGRLAGAYENYLLVRPYPNLRILFASPSLRIPGTLQSHFLAKVGGPDHVRDELLKAFEDGTVVTARIRWVTKHDQEGRPRWIHCTPLLGTNGAVGVWMVVLVEDDEVGMRRRSLRLAPPIDPPMPVYAARIRRLFDDGMDLAGLLSLGNGGDEVDEVDLEKTS